MSTSVCRKNKVKTRQQAWTEANRDKARASVRAYYARNKDKHRAWWLDKAYRLSSAEYEVMLAAQGGVCKACGQPESRIRSGRVLRLCVDHAHATGAVRGLLCAGCNSALGHTKENPATLRKLADYIEHFKE